MSGHSKWASIKHKKAIVDSRRGVQFTKLGRAITIAAREGGGDIAGNPSLAIAVQKAKAASMPKDNILRAIAKGSGAGADVNAIERVMYEGYGPGGVAILVTALTDNRNRTGGEIRHMFSKAGGSLAEPGAVSYLFDKRGMILVDRELTEDEQLELIEAGADDIDGMEVICQPADLSAVRSAVEQLDIGIIEHDLVMQPTTTVPLDDKALTVMSLLEKLEDQDDVEKVYANAEFPDES